MDGRGRKRGGVEVGALPPGSGRTAFAALGRDFLGPRPQTLRRAAPVPAVR